MDLDYKSTGAVYTPPETVKYILDEIGYLITEKIENKYIIDPSCGLGIFLSEIVTRLIQRYSQIGFDPNNPKDAKSIIENVVKHVYGVDINQDSCNETKIILNKLLNPLLQKAREIDSGYDFSLNILCCNALQKTPIDQMKFDYVVGNPPYIRIQRIKPDSLRDEYKQNFLSAVGRFDTSVLFIEKGISLLQTNGRLGYIVSNKCLTANYSVGIKRVIISKTQLKKIVDLSDLGLFSASVLPCILLLEKSSGSSDNFKYCVLKKSKKTFDLREEIDVFDLLKKYGDFEEFTKIVETKINNKTQIVSVQCYTVKTPALNQTHWYFIPNNEQSVINKIEKNKTCTLSQLCEKISVGIKTTDNPVFTDPLTKNYIAQQEFEKELIRDSLRGSNIQKWHINWSEKSNTSSYLIYPHEKKNGRVIPVDLANFPNIKKYLDAHRERLERRYYLSDANRQWYELWVHQDPDDFKQKNKIVTADISSHNRFAIDSNNYFCLDSCYYLLLKNNSDAAYKLILGLLNSKLIEFYHKRVASTHIYSNKYRYMSSNLKKYPIVFNLEDIHSKKIIIIVDDLTKLFSGTPSKAQILELENKLNAEVYELYKITDAEQKIIEMAIDC